MGLAGPSKTIQVTPIKQPVVTPTPAKEPVREKVPA